MSFQNRFGNDSVNSSQEILRKVPGLFIDNTPVEESRANISKRIDIDHGTDIAISVDGMPVIWSAHGMVKAMLICIL
jgi:hypothetical protein